ncbi:hypothetical protein REC12_07965 [Desulfosporosinus sp. PR]|nr:hypothetical protein [Desulfosporosinus sp. PR]MDQ7093521.1 hypothetical protein [Desulfosporosinus sp. PR]
MSETPKISEAGCIKSEHQSFSNRVFDRAFKPLLVTFLQEEELSKADMKN